MKRTIRITLTLILLFFLAYIGLGQTGALMTYKIPTTGNEPNIKLNSTIFVSNLVDYEIGDFVCFEYLDKNSKMGIHVKRLVAKENDEVEIKDGILFVNGQNIDENFELRHTYIINEIELQELQTDNKIDKDDMLVQMDDRVIVAIDDKIADEYNLLNKMKIDPKGQANRSVKEQYSENWNLDNFGPLIIPKGKCFFIGDNRHNSADSRVNGLINEKDIVGKVLKK